MAVAHQHIGACLPHPALQQGSLTLGESQRGRAGERPLVPHRGVLGRRGFRAYAQMMPCENRPPGELGKLDHPVIGQKLREIAAHGSRRGLIGGCQIAQQTGSAFGAGRRGASVRGQNETAWLPIVTKAGCLSQALRVSALSGAAVLSCSLCLTHLKFVPSLWIWTIRCGPSGPPFAAQKKCSCSG